jgi:hypothetical protein
MNEIITTNVVANDLELNRDPLTGTPGAHPLGTSIGAAAGGLAGAAAGMSIGGPVGGLVGAAVGAIAGGITGSSAAESVNPTLEETFWRQTFIREPYYAHGRNYEYYAPGFRAGWEGRVKHDGRSFEAAEADLAIDYEATKSEIDPTWIEIRPAALAAWNRVHHSLLHGT